MSDTTPEVTKPGVEASIHEKLEWLFDKVEGLLGLKDDSNEAESVSQDSNGDNESDPSNPSS